MSKQSRFLCIGGFLNGTQVKDQGDSFVCVEKGKNVTYTKKEYFSVSKMPRFDNAQVCRGGVSLDELTEDFELKKAPGVYVIGEMCDVDGKCGGYNLHWAWLSANLCCE